jgi:aminoglycoside 3-N-acetyltransferase
MTAGDKLDLSMDLDSPLGRLYELGGHVLLLGATHESNTSLHLAEYLWDTEAKHRVECFAPVQANGARRWARVRGGP